jgi:two-component system response regulator WspF
MRIGLASDDLRDIPSLCRLIESAPGFSLAWVASDGREAIAKAGEDKPDLILMKLDLPVLDGVQATRIITQRFGCPILILTPTVAGHSGRVFEAMGCGAIDVVASPAVGPSGELTGGPEVLRKLTIISRLIGDKSPQGRATVAKKPATSQRSGVPPLVAIGASTGGPKALAAILSTIPPTTGAAFVIVQHVDKQFVSGLIEWLGAQTDLKVALAREGMSPQPNQALLAGGEDHLVLGADRTFRYVAEPRDYPYRPSVDTFFRSLKENWPRPDLAVLLTGMGRDGAAGLLALRQAGWKTVVEDKATCTVFGMPKAAIECGAAAETLPLSQIADFIMRHVEPEEK